MQGSHQEEIRAPNGVSSQDGARKGAAGLALSPTSQPRPDPGGLSAGKAGAGASEHRWLRGQGLGAEGRQEMAAPA